MAEESTIVESEKLNVFSEDILLLIIRRRRFILFFATCSLILGVIIAVLSSKTYTSNVIVVPQMSSSQGVSKKYAKIAALAGINLSSGETTNILPTIYPVIMSSTPFQKELLKTPLTIKGQDSLVSLTYYLSNIKKASFLEKVKKYTIGLPGLLINSLKTKEKSISSLNDDSTIIKLTAVENQQTEFLKSALSIDYNDVDGYIEIKGTLPEALASAELTNKAYKLLQEYIIEYNIEKSRDELLYIQNRFNEAEEDFFAKRAVTGRFGESNQNLISSPSINKREQYKLEYELAYSLYSGLSTELENAKLQVKKDTPIFTIIKPVTVPIEPSSPNTIMTIFIVVFLGVVFSIVTILFKYFLPFIRNYIKS